MKLVLLAWLLSQAPVPESQAREYYQQKNAERRQLWEKKQYGQAAALLEELAARPEIAGLDDLALDATYNLACAYALLGQKDKALARLRQAEALGLWKFYGNVRRDTDFDNIREAPEFREMLKRLRAQAIPLLQWSSCRVRVDPPDRPEMAQLREVHGLDRLVAGAADDYEKLRRIVKWSHDRWAHAGDNQPSRPDPLTILREASQGKRFRCVEYATVVAAAANALGLPARSLALKTRDVETRFSGAGHVVAEVWLKQFNKWALADGQWDAIPEHNGVPLNAVELQDAIARDAPDLVIRTSSKTDPGEFLGWIAPYLYYFDYQLDQRFYSGEKPGWRLLMLVPKGAKPPAVFQRRFPIGDAAYISDPEIFYAPPGPATLK